MQQPREVAPPAPGDHAATVRLWAELVLAALDRLAAQDQESAQPASKAA
jgi:hypothetical protein